MRTLAALLLLGLVVAACRASPPAADPGAGTPVRDPSPASPAPTGSPPSPATDTDRPPPAADPPAQIVALFDFEADDVRGGQVVGAELVGRDVAVWIWAPW